MTGPGDPFQGVPRRVGETRPGGTQASEVRPVAAPPPSASLPALEVEPEAPRGRRPSDQPVVSRRAIVIAVGIHGIILGVVIFGLPELWESPPPPPPPISMTIGPIAKIATSPDTQTKKGERDPQPAKAERPKPPRQELNPSPPPPPPPPKAEAPKPPPPKSPPPPPPKAAETPKAETPKPPPPPPKSPPPLKATETPKSPPPKAAPKSPPPPPPKETPKSLDDLLAAEAGPVNKAPNPAAPPDVDPNAKGPGRAREQRQGAAVAAAMTADEFAALRQQLASCWVLPVGSADIANVVVPLRVQVHEDKTVAQVAVVDAGRYQSDALFRAAADAAVAAVRQCSPLAVPDGKHDAWKDMTINFRPN